MVILGDIKMVRVEPDQTAGLTLYWWQRLITFNSSRIRVKESLCIKVIVALKFKNEKKIQL